MRYMSGIHSLNIPIRSILIGSVVLVMGFLLQACKLDVSTAEDTADTSLSRIREKGVLSVITDYNSTTYFVYRGEPMGFHYELLKRFADHLGVQLDIGVSTDLDRTFSCLADGGVDLVAMDMTITRERNERFDFTIPIMQSRQVLVQRQPDPATASPAENPVAFIKTPLDLAGKTVHIQKNEAFTQRLMHLQEEIGDSIHIIQDPANQVEALITKVARGEIDYTVADEHVALVNRTYYPNINVTTAISFPQNQGWAVPKGADSLRFALNEWLLAFLKTSEYKVIYNKYFFSRKSFGFQEREFISAKSGKISEYDEYIKKFSRKAGWDWRLVASLIYQESKFHPEIRAWSGAFGLMQLMPETAAYFGIDSLSPPDKQIEAGVKYLKYLDDQLGGLVRDKEERRLFILAAYNVGVGHVLDARRLADKYGRNANAWFGNVDTFLLVKSEPKYYQDSVVYYGYARGEEPVRFVREIMDRYELYRTVIPE